MARKTTETPDENVDTEEEMDFDEENRGWCKNYYCIYSVQLKERTTHTL